MSIAGTLLRSRAVAALASPHGIDRYLELVNPMWAAHEVRARLVEIRREVDVPGEPAVATLTFQPTSTWRGHRPGQYVQLAVDLPGARRLTRCFTLSSAGSRPGERFSVTMRANPDGEVSRYLVDQAAVGQVVHLSQAAGDFVLPDAVPEHVLFITGGSGITPAMAMLRSLLLRTHRGRVTFLHYTRSAEHQIFRAELEEIGTTGYGVDLHLVYPEQGGRNFSPMELERIVPHFREVDTWLCGPAGLVEAVRPAYEVDGVPNDRLRVEYFKPPRTSGLAGGRLAFDRSGVVADNSGQSILEQAEAAGLSPTFGCRMGICFSCTATKTEGKVRNVLTGETSDRPDEEIRICVSSPEGDCAIDL
ncbi:ferredoxin reductase [Nocardioides sp. BP30]|uniref:ferredoxin reductase n=1 Tax=Nocardioides sp. BP30 TaxID=3036374 RepID=UPI002469326F|nr:ferredoxin reductase [Nocardioides sp. BP30]WGL51292.1 ferredoxin reductase [Nocardioides sp. BP30]